MLVKPTQFWVDITIEIVKGEFKIQEKSNSEMLAKATQSQTEKKTQKVYKNCGLL